MTLLLPPTDVAPAKQAALRSPGEPRSRPRGVARAVVWFALPGLAALVLVGIVAVVVFQERAEQEAVRDARQMTRAIGLGMLGPRLTEDVMRRDDEAVRRLDAYVDTRVREVAPSIRRIKIWREGGTIAYSDDPRLVGRTHDLDPDVLAMFGGDEPKAGISNLRPRENRFERPLGKLLEVYQPVVARSGRPVLVEIYYAYSSVAAEARGVWLDFAPALLAALMLLWLVQLPLAWTLVHRLQRGRQEREALLVQAMEASDAERRRIAGTLHDGVVQDLAGLSLSLAAAAERTDDPPLSTTLAKAARSTRQSIRQMRSLLVDIYPANLQTAGLHAALSDLLAPLAARGLTTNAFIDEAVAASPDVEQLVFRTAQEALRNVQQHAGASSVELRAELANGLVTLSVEDDGRGFDAGDAHRSRAGGHLGLLLLGDRAAVLGGRLSVDSELGRGTTVRLEVPAA